MAETKVLVPGNWATPYPIGFGRESDLEGVTPILLIPSLEPWTSSAKAILERITFD